MPPEIPITLREWIEHARMSSYDAVGLHFDASFFSTLIISGEIEDSRQRPTILVRQLEAGIVRELLLNDIGVEANSVYRHSPKAENPSLQALCERVRVAQKFELVIMMEPEEHDVEFRLRDRLTEESDRHELTIDDLIMGTSGIDETLRGIFASITEFPWA